MQYHDAQERERERERGPLEGEVLNWDGHMYGERNTESNLMLQVW